MVSVDTVAVTLKSPKRFNRKRFAQVEMIKLEGVVFEHQNPPTDIMTCTLDVTAKVTLQKHKYFNGTRSGLLVIPVKISGGFKLNTKTGEIANTQRLWLDTDTAKKLVNGSEVELSSLDLLELRRRPITVKAVGYTVSALVSNLKSRGRKRA